jgi:hypothetical protein
MLAEEKEIWHGFVAQILWTDSMIESSMIALVHEQLDPYEIHEQELVILQ